MYFRETDNLGLRNFERSDLLKYKDFLNDHRVTKYLEMGDKPTSEKILEDTYNEANFSNNDVVFSAEIKRGKIFIGTTGLYLINWVARRAQFRILLGDVKFYGKGFGTEITRLVIDYGFNRLNLESIYLGVNEKNIAAIKTYEKAGFISNGKYRKFIYNNGEYYDSVNMTITKEDFKSGIMNED